MSAPAIDFAALLAEARMEARARRQKQQQEQQQQEQQQLRQQHLRRQQQQQQQEDQQHGDQQREDEQQEEQQQEEGERQEELEVWKKEQHVQFDEVKQTQDGESQRLDDRVLFPSTLQQASRGEEQCSERDKQLLEAEQEEVDSLQETLEAIGGDACCNALSRVRLRAVDVQYVYNALQQQSVGVGKRLLLVDLRSSSNFASKHVCQAVSGQQLLQDEQLLQRLRQQQLPERLLVYGCSHEEEESFQRLMRGATRVAATATKTQSSVNAAAAATASTSQSAAAASLLLLQLLQTLLQRSFAAGAAREQELQQSDTEQMSQSLAGRVSDRSHGAQTAPREEKTVEVAWLCGGMETFAVAFPFLCVSSNTEEEATAALTAANSMAYLSYPALVYCSRRDAAADSTSASLSPPASAAGEEKTIERPAADSHASRLSAAPASSVCPGGSPAAASSLGGTAAAVPHLAEAPSAVQGLYVGTTLHAMSRAVRRRLRIGLIIDLTAAGLENSSSRRDRVPSSTWLGSSRRTLNCETGSRRDSGPTSGDGGEEEGKEELEQVVRPLLSPDTRAAARSFLGYGSSSDDDQQSSAVAYPWWLEGMPQRRREIATTMGRYLLPLDACIELLKRHFDPPEGRNHIGVSCDIGGAPGTEETAAASWSTCSSSGAKELSNSRRRDITTTTRDRSPDHRGGRSAHTQLVKGGATGGKKSADTLLSEVGSSRNNGHQRKSVLIVHSGDSEPWSGSAAVTVVAGFLFAQQKRLQLVLPRQEARMAVALLTAYWRSAPALEESHRQQLQRFCEEERKRRSRNRFTASTTGVANVERKPYEESSAAASYKRATSQASPAHPLSPSVSPGIAAGTARQHESVRQSQEKRSCTSGGIEKRKEKEEQADSTRVKRRDADDAYLTAATALHTVTLCGLPASPVFIMSEEEERWGSLLRRDAVKEEEGREDTESGREERKRDDEWPHHLLTNLEKITQQVRLVAAASATDHQGVHGKALESVFSTREDSIDSSDWSVSQGSVVERVVAVDSRSATTRRDYDTTKRLTSGETAADDSGDSKTERLKHRECDAASMLGPCGDGNHESDQPLVSGKNEVYEVGAICLFARLSMEGDADIREMEVPTSQAATAFSERAPIVETDAAAALQARRIAGRRLCELAVEAQRRCPEGTLGKTTHAVPECVDVCEAWELAANTVGCIVEAWSSSRAKRGVSRVCEALGALLELLASACSATLWTALSTVETRVNVSARVTAAWGAILLNISLLWLHMAHTLYKSDAETSESGLIERVHRENNSPAHRESHLVLGETLLTILLHSILQLVKQLLLRQFSSNDGEGSVSRDQRLPSSPDVRSDQTARNVSVSSREFSARVATGHTHMTARRLPPHSAEKEEAWFLGFPTLGLRLLLCALHGAFLRPQIVPKLQKKLLRAAALPAHSGLPPVVFARDTSATALALEPAHASPTSSAATAEASAAAAVSSIRRILKSDAVQTTLYLAEVWAAVHPENLQKLLGEALRGQEGALHEREHEVTQGLEKARLPASLGVALRPYVFASEEYAEHKR